MGDNVYQYTINYYFYAYMLNLDTLLRSEKKNGKGATTIIVTTTYKRHVQAMD